MRKLGILCLVVFAVAAVPPPAMADCRTCPNGGAVSGIGGDGRRYTEPWDGEGQVCTLDYTFRGRPFVHLELNGRPWPNPEWGVAKDTFEVKCREDVLIVCNEWDVRLQDHRKTDWRGVWQRAPGASGYTATWESLSTGERIRRAVFPKSGEPLQFVSEDPGGVRITYYSRRFGSPPGEIRGDYEMQGPGGPVLTGQWWARCVDPGPFRRTWTP